jgi:ribose 5-phosphate isomerase B
MSQPSVSTVCIGNDHGGVEVKNEICRLLAGKGVRVVNVGTDTTEICRYPHFAHKVAGAVARGEADRGILICSTGIGMSIAANKIKGVRAALCTSTYMAKMTRQHNDSNVLCLGGKVTGIFEILDIVETWLAEDYIGGRHDISLGILREQEEQLGLQVPPAEP